MSRSKIDKSLREKQGKRLTNEIIARYGKHGNGPSISKFAHDLDKMGLEMISTQTLSRICHGRDPIDSHAKAFSTALNVREEYLLCIDDYPHEDDRKQSIIRDYWTQWHNDSADRVRIVKSITALLESRSIQTVYDTKEGYQIRKADTQYIASSKDDLIQIPEDHFYSWLDTFAMCIRVSEDKWIHMSKVYVIAPDQNMIELNMNDYMKMIYDINDEINHRVHSWFSLHSYSIDESWNQSFDYYEDLEDPGQKKTATEETSDSL